MICSKQGKGNKGLTKKLGFRFALSKEPMSSILAYEVPYGRHFPQDSDFGPGNELFHAPQERSGLHESSMDLKERFLLFPSNKSSARSWYRSFCL